MNRLLTSLSLLLFALAHSAQANGLKLPEFSRHTLDNGATVQLMRKADVPLVALDITLRGGALADAPGKAGTANLLADLMQKGAGERDARAFVTAIDEVGGRLSIGSGRHALSLNAEFLSPDATRMLELAADALRRPQLSAAEFEKVRTRSIQSLQAAKDADPSDLIDSYGEAWLFGEHPYGLPVGGSEQSLAAISHQDVLDYARQQLGGDRLIISVVGDFDEAAMLAAIRARFGDWPAASATLADIPAVPAARPEGARRVLLIDKPGATQTYFWLGNVGAAINDPQRIAQDLVQTVFGGRFTSMLNSELRVKSGLTYGARANLQRGLQPGAAAITSFTRTDATEQAIDLALQTLDRLHADGIDQALLDSGRNYMLGQFPPTLETAAQLAGELGAQALYGLGREEIDQFGARLAALDVATVKSASQVFAPSAQLSMVLIGDAKTIRAAVAKYGTVTEMDLTDPSFSPGRR